MTGLPGWYNRMKINDQLHFEFGNVSCELESCIRMSHLMISCRTFRMISVRLLQSINPTPLTSPDNVAMMETLLQAFLTGIMLINVLYMMSPRQERVIPGYGQNGKLHLAFFTRVNCMHSLYLDQYHRSQRIYL